MLVFNERSVVTIPRNIKGEHGIFFSINDLVFSNQITPPTIGARYGTIASQGMIDQDDGGSVQWLSKNLVGQLKLLPMPGNRGKIGNTNML